MRNTVGNFAWEQIHTGEHAGQWLVSIIYPDWATYGKATQSLAEDAEHTKLRDKFAESARMEDRTDPCRLRGANGGRPDD